MIKVDGQTDHPMLTEISKILRFLVLPFLPARRNHPMALWNRLFRAFFLYCSRLTQKVIIGFARARNCGFGGCADDDETRE